MNSTEIGELIGGVIAIFMGLVVIIKPRILAWVIGIYLLIIGVIGVVAAFT